MPINVHFLAVIGSSNRYLRTAKVVAFLLKTGDQGTASPSRIPDLTGKITEQFTGMTGIAHARHSEFMVLGLAGTVSGHSHAEFRALKAEPIPLLKA